MSGNDEHISVGNLNVHPCHKLSLFLYFVEF